MIFPIYLYGEDILRKKAEDVNIEDDLLPSLIKDMFETMYNADGSGISGPQIGLSSRIFVVDEEINGEIFKGVFINPKITFSSNYTSSMKEGCLSFPQISATIVRPFSIDLEWYDENKQFHSETFENIKARIIQHEIDHLNGILMVDRMRYEEKMNQFMILEIIKNKKINAKYKTK